MDLTMTLMLAKDGFIDWPIGALKKYEKIGINLSGGTDSAMALNLALRYRSKHHKFVCITGVDKKRPSNEDAAHQIIQKLAEIHQVELNRFDHLLFYYEKPTPDSKTAIHEKFEKKLFDEGAIDILIHGRTANPTNVPELMDGREPNRDPSNKNYQTWFPGKRSYFMPFRNITKRSIAELYDRQGLMDDIFPLTASCVAYPEETEFYTKPCEKCWWCREKFWAFGAYDGGIPNPVIYKKKNIYLKEEPCLSHLS